MNLGSSSNAIADQKAFRSFGYALVFLMMVGAAMTAGSFIRNTLPDWPSGLITSVALCVVIERLYTYRQMKSLALLSPEWVTALGAQWVVILVFIRLALAYPNGLDAFITDMRLFTAGDPTKLFTPQFYISLLLAFTAWDLCGRFLELLEEVTADQKPTWLGGFAPIQGSEATARQRLVNLVFSTGIFLAILTVMARLNLLSELSTAAGIRNGEAGRLSGGEAGVLLYFIFGLALLSLSRLMSLQARWNRQGIPISSKDLARRWAVYSLFFLLVLAAIASLLPAGDSLGLFSVLGTLLGFLFSVLLFLSQLTISLIVLLFSLPFLLFGKGLESVSGPIPPVLPTLPAEIPPPTPDSAAWVLIRSILLWTFLLGIIVYSLKHFVGQHKGIGAALGRLRLAMWLLLAWQWLHRNAGRTRASLSRAITDGWQSLLGRLEGRRRLPPVNLISLRSLEARRRIYFFYLAMVRRGGEQGLRRKPAQTPAEYAVQLENALPSAGEDIAAITKAFVEARYSCQEVEPTKAELVKATWRRIRRALQVKSRSEPSGHQ